jgi:hypothetical protein
MEPSVCPVNGETTPGERTLDHGVSVVQSTGHQEETLEKTIGTVRSGRIARGIVVIIEVIAQVTPKWVESETTTHEGGTPILARVVHVPAGRNHLIIIIEMTIIRSVSVEGWKRDIVFQPRYVCHSD